MCSNCEVLGNFLTTHILCVIDKPSGELFTIDYRVCREFKRFTRIVCVCMIDLNFFVTLWNHKRNSECCSCSLSRSHLLIVWHYIDLAIFSSVDINFTSVVDYIACRCVPCTIECTVCPERNVVFACDSFRKSSEVIAIFDFSC